MIHSSLVQTSAPAVEPLSLAEAKANLLVEHTGDDALITQLISAARSHIERHTARTLITSTWQVSYDGGQDFCDGFELPRPPIQSVTSVVYVDTDGVTQTLATSKYRVDAASEPGRITPALNQSWPTFAAVTGAVTATYVAGFGDASTDVPDDLLAAVKVLLGHLYENREAVAHSSLKELPLGLQYMLDTYMILRVG